MGYGMYGIWDVWDMGCMGYGMYGIWNVWDMRCMGYGMYGIWDVSDMGCLGYGMCGICEESFLVGGEEYYYPSHLLPILPAWLSKLPGTTKICFINERSIYLFSQNFA